LALLGLDDYSLISNIEILGLRLSADGMQIPNLHKAQFVACKAAATLQ